MKTNFFTTGAVALLFISCSSTPPAASKGAAASADMDNDSSMAGNMAGGAPDNSGLASNNLGNSNNMSGDALDKLAPSNGSQSSFNSAGLDGNSDAFDPEGSKKETKEEIAEALPTPTAPMAPPEVPKQANATPAEPLPIAEKTPVNPVIETPPANPVIEPPPANSVVAVPPANPIPEAKTPPAEPLPVAETQPAIPAAEPVAVETAPTKPNYRVLTEEERASWLKAAQRLKPLSAEDTPTEYVVQHGDTLWDICDQLLDDAHWWPKLWTLNPQIQNPHLIYPGQRIVFGGSDGIAAPSIAVHDLGTATPIAAKSVLVNSLGRNSHPWQDKESELIDPSELENDPSFLDIAGRQGPNTIVVQLPGFVSNSEPEILGTIVKAGEGFSQRAKGAIAYAEMTTPPTPGQRFLVLHIADQSTDPNGDFIGDAQVYLYAGIVGVTKINHSGLVSLFIEESRHGVQEDDILIPFHSIYQAIDPSSSGRTANIRATVLAMGDRQRTIAGTGSTIILEADEGKVSPGDDIDVYMPPGSITNFEQVSADDNKVARVRVLEQTGNSISAVVISVKEELVVGAKTYPVDE